MSYLTANIPLPSYQCPGCGHYGSTEELKVDVDSADEPEEDGYYPAVQTFHCPNCGGVVGNNDIDE